MKAIRHFRKAAKLTQADLAQRLECSQPRMSAIESGQIAPRIDELYTIADILGCTPTQLIEWREPPPEPAPTDEDPTPAAA